MGSFMVGTGNKERQGRNAAGGRSRRVWRDRKGGQKQARDRQERNDKEVRIQQVVQRNNNGGGSDVYFNLIFNLTSNLVLIFNLN